MAAQPQYRAGGVRGAEVTIHTVCAGGNPFIANPNEEKLLGTTAFRQKIATAIANGIISYFHWFDNQKPIEETLMKPDAAQVKAFLLQLQDNLCQQLSAVDARRLSKMPGSGKAVAADAAGCCAKAGCSSRRGQASMSMATPCLPRHRAPPGASRTQFEAMGVSLVVHPANPTCRQPCQRAVLYCRKPARPGVVVQRRF